MSTSEDHNDTSPPTTPRLGDLIWVGTACAISVLAGGGIGYLLDGWLHTTPALSFVGLGFGVVSAFMLAWAQVRKFTR